MTKLPGQIILILIVTFFMTLTAAVPAQAEEFNHCAELPCVLETQAGADVTVSGEYTSNEEHVHLDTLVTDQNGSPQIRVNLDFTRLSNSYEITGSVIRYGENVFGLPELTLAVDQVVPFSEPGWGGFTPVTADEAVGLTFLTGLIDTTLGGDVTTLPCDNGDEGGDCTKTERGPFESSFTLSYFLFIPIWEGQGAKECAVKHDVCYENATSQAERLQCDLDLVDCLMEAEPWGFGGHILTGLGTSVGGLFVFNPSTDECLCEYSITDEQAATLAPAGSHDVVITYKNDCCEPGSNCVEGNKCEVVAYDATIIPDLEVRILQPVVTMEGKCKKNPNYEAQQAMCEDPNAPVDCEGCPIH